MRTFSLKSLFLILIAGSLLAWVKEDPGKLDSTTSSKQYTRAYGDKLSKVIAIIETNDTDPRNVLSYHLETSADGPLFFDIVKFFAANIHKDANNNPTIYFNSEQAPLMADTVTYVKPLKDAVLKVVLSILGDWQGIGVANMTEFQADKFTDILVLIVKTYGLDGVGFDDEYANYHYGNLIDGSYGHIIEQLHTKLDAEFSGTHNCHILILNQVRIRSMQASQGGYGVISTDDMRSADNIDPLNVFAKIAEGAFEKTATYDGNNYAKNRISSGSQTISRNDCDLL